MIPGVWDPPGLGIEPVAPALAGGFLTTEPAGDTADHPLQGYLKGFSAAENSPCPVSCVAPPATALGLIPLLALGQLSGPIAWPHLGSFTS